MYTNADEIPIPRNNSITHDLVAKIFASNNKNKVAYDYDAKRWYVWDRTRWRVDRAGTVSEIARELCRMIAKGRDSDDAKRIGNKSFINGVLDLAKSDPLLAVPSSIWDSDPLLLGTPDGTIDLRTGMNREADPADRITKLTAVGPADTAHCPRFHAFLDETTQEDQHVKSFILRWFGYCLTGTTHEQKFVFFYGPGGNGKGVLVNTILKIMGDYAQPAQMSTFTAKRFDAHPEEIASLQGARMVTASETEAGHNWAAARIKELTGGDQISARHLYKDRFAFTPQCKFTFVGNHAPAFEDVDEGVRRRVIVLPLTYVPAHPDLELEDKLRIEWPGILKLISEACADALQGGLQVPSVLQDATKEYLSAQDIFGSFLEEHVELVDDDSVHVASSDLFWRWREHAEEHGEQFGTGKTFAERMRRVTGRKPVQIKKLGKRGYRGVRLRKP